MKPIGFAAPPKGEQGVMRPLCTVCRICISKWAYAQTAALEGCLTLAPGSEAAVWDN